jgi:3-oxoacyl-[acyl-carrier protein] reductase
MTPLAGRRVLITGSRRRTGWAIARAVAAQGATVFVHGRAPAETGERCAALTGLGAMAAHDLHGDLTDPHAVAELARAAVDLGGIDSLVNNVGVYRPTALVDTDPAHWRWTMAGNLDATFFVSQAFAPQLLDSRRSRIVNIGSTTCDRVQAAAQTTAYQIAKTGIHALTLSYAKAHAAAGLTANTVSPGQLENSIDHPGDGAFPTGRAVREDELAAAVCYLLSPAADSVTGSNIELTGGWQR